MPPLTAAHPKITYFTVQSRTDRATLPLLTLSCRKELGSNHGSKATKIMAGAETSLIPVVVGGLLTIGGGAVAVIGSILVEARKSAEEKRKHRADKFEDIVKAVYELDHWLDRERDLSLTGVGDPLEVSPFAKLQAISAIHFPSIDPFIEALQTAVQQYTAWNAAARVKMVSGELKELPPDYTATIKPYTVARDNLLEALKSLASREFR
jgi:hypothetical protein